ncbi:hypothetical protein K8I28_06385 [bacterium]|nr:hypothetical protein [bacterium]
MNNLKSSPTYYIGWDVGGWNCDKNPRSRDAVVILDDKLTFVGKSWRGNLRDSINKAESTVKFLEKLFSLCDPDKATVSGSVYLAIDTPLGFPKEFINLITSLETVKSLDESGNNPYLFRKTERYLFQMDMKPLSAVKDMIGSQATKGLHVLGKYAPHVRSCGVWTNTGKLTALETYPSAAKKSPIIKEILKRFEPLNQDGDKFDALICAIIAYLYAAEPEALAAPGKDIPIEEGWIWVPKDAFEQDKTIIMKG